MIRFTFRPDLDATVFEVTEQLSVPEYTETMEAFMASEDFRPGMPGIWDFRTIPGHEVTTADIQAVASYNETIAGKRGSTWRVAIVVSSDLAFGLGRMFQAYCNAAPNEVMIFRSMEEAEGWVSEPRSG